MSHTDKHRPVWVQLADPENRAFAQENHNHSDGTCDLGADPRYNFHWRRWDHCYISESSLGYRAGMWPRYPRKGGWSRNRRDGKARMRLQQLKREVLKVHRTWVCCSAPWNCYPDWEDHLPDWNEHRPTNQWLWWKSD